MQTIDEKIRSTMSNDNVLFIRGNREIHQEDSDINDIWDDSILIKAYDKAVSLAKEQVAKRLSGNTNRTNQYDLEKYRHENAKEKQWVVGSPCRAVYSLDGEIYEANIIKIFHDINKCLVKFVGYGNIEKVELSSLYPSNGLESCLAQQVLFDTSTDNDPKKKYTYKQNNSNYHIKENFKYENISTHHKSASNLSFSSEFKMPTAPPIPPHMLTHLPSDNSEALSSMLMSWYISGFHTGYYLGIKQAQQSHEKRKKME